MFYLIILTIISTLPVFSQDSYEYAKNNIDINDSSFKGYLETFINKTSEQFLIEMHKNGFCYQRLICWGDKPNIIQKIVIGYRSGVVISLNIGDIPITAFDSTDIDQKDFKLYSKYKIQKIKVQKRTVNPPKPIFEEYWISKGEE